MRPLAGFVALNGLALVLGLAVLYAAALWRPRLADLPGAAAAGLLTGLGAIGLGALFALLAGLGMDLAVLAPATLLVAAALALIGRRRSARDRRLEAEPGGSRRARWLLPAVVVLFVAIQIALSRRVPIAWDAAHIWSIKAIALSDWGSLDGALFTDAGAFGIAHLDYPLGWPVLGSLVLRAAGTGEQGLLIAELWLILGAAVLAVPWLVRPGRWTVLAFAPMLLALASGPSAGVLRGDADVPMACFLAVGVAALARALESGRSRYAVLAAICLGMAANTKNEGLAFAAGAVVVAFAVALAIRRRRNLVTIALAGVALIALALPWKLWTSAHGPFASDVAPLSDSLDLGYLADKLPQLDLGAQTMLGRIAEPSSYWLVPALLALAGAAFVLRRLTPLAGLYLGAVVASVLAVLWVYWTSQIPDIAGHVGRTTIRTITGPLFIAAAGLAHLLPRLVGEARLEELVAARAEPEPAAREPAVPVSS